MSDNWRLCLPFVENDIFTSDLNMKIEKYLEQIVPVHKENERRRSAPRTDSQIRTHSNAGIRKEIAFVFIQGLKENLIDFSVTNQADKYDIKVDAFTRVDVTTANVESFKENDDGSFDLVFSIKSSKLESIRKRSGGNRYQANKIAFLKEESGKIYYLGQINKHSLLRAQSTIKNSNNKCCCFSVRGTRMPPDDFIKNEIILDL